MRSILLSYENEGREVSDARLKRLTEGLWSVEVHIHGEPEPEEIAVFSRQEVDELKASTPFGGSSRRREE